MKCYRCNCQLDNNSDYCLKCGADVSVYKIVDRASNSDYTHRSFYQYICMLFYLFFVCNISC